MAKLPRVTQKIFAQNSGTNDVTVFGTAKNGSDAVFTKDISQIMNSDAFSQGWGSATLTDDAPFQEDMNGVQLALSQQLAYFFEKGMPEWDENTTYYANTSFCQVNGVWYQSLTDNNIGNNPVNDTTNWYQIDLDKLNPDLSNLSATGLDKLNQSKALETGSVSSDADIYADVLKYAHSTFDKSKFEVVGSPVITKDGLASRISSSNNIRLPIMVSSLKGKSWSVRSRWINQNNTSSTGDVMLNFGGSWGAWGCVNVFPKNSSFQVNLRCGTEEEPTTEGPKINVKFSQLPDFIDALVTFDYNTGTYSLYYDIGAGETLGGTYTPETSNKELYTINVNPTNRQMSMASDASDSSSNNQIDLKRVSVVVDGFPVFSGNITGIDTIKPDDYTVVGTPTISDAGIFNNNSSNKNLITIPLTYGDFLNKSWEVRTCAYVVPKENKSYLVFDNSYSTLGSLVWSSGIKICAKFGDESDSSAEIYVADLPTSMPEGWYNLSMAFNYITGEYTSKAINIATGTVYSNTYTPTTANKQLYTFNTKTASTKINLIRATNELVTDLNGVQVAGPTNSSFSRTFSTGGQIVHTNITSLPIPVKVKSFVKTQSPHYQEPKMIELKGKMAAFKQIPTPNPL